MFRIYQSGREYIEDNREIFERYPLESIFFEGNAAGAMYENISDGFAVKVNDEKGLLLAIRYLDFPMVVFGDTRLCGELAEGLFKNGLVFSQLMDIGEHGESFFEEYEKLTGGTHRFLRCMDIMSCKSLKETDSAETENASIADSEEIAELYTEFHREALHEEIDPEKIPEKIRNEAANYIIIKRDGRIASIAERVRETDRLCGISMVYTRREYRGQGLARRIVTRIAGEVLKCNKLPYLYVDRSNPISNHIYSSIGFEYDIPHTVYKYIPKA